MTIQYKNQGFKQTDTSKTTVLTCPADGTIIVKTIYCANNDASSAILVNMKEAPHVRPMAIIKRIFIKKLFTYSKMP